jgi:hypothetical protein
MLTTGGTGGANNMIFFLYNQPVRWMVVGADVNDDLL